MKKKLFIGLAGLAAVAATAFFTVYAINANSKSELSALMIENLEALSQNETGGGSGPACTGPKETDHWGGRPYCHSSNEYPCKDETGCD
jgi:hypothetical protein